MGGLVCLFLGVSVFWNPARAGTWISLPAKYTVLRYQETAHLETFNRRINFGGGADGFLFFGSGRRKDSSLEQEVCQKLDRLVEKVQLILDMQRPFPRVFINVYPDEESLHRAYFRVHGKRGKPRAWYTFRQNTIYLNLLDVFSGMLAHELAHAVVDHYLGVRPPRATAEILARYVDSHLEEEVRIYP